MKTPIIDVSASPFGEFLRRHGTTEGLLYAFWYRVARPAMVMMVWVLFCLYIYHSLVTVGGTAAELASLIGYVLVVASMAAGLIAWLIICAFHNWIRMRDREEAGEPYETDELAARARWPLPEGERCVLVCHDESGQVVDVKRWREPAQAEPIVGAALDVASSYAWDAEPSETARSSPEDESSDLPVAYMPLPSSDASRTLHAILHRKFSAY